MQSRRGRDHRGVILFRHQLDPLHAVQIVPTCSIANRLVMTQWVGPISAWGGLRLEGPFLRLASRPVVTNILSDVAEGKRLCLVGVSSGGKCLVDADGGNAWLGIFPGTSPPSFAGDPINGQDPAGLHPPDAGPLEIVTMSGGAVPYDAIVGGTEPTGETLYLCAARFMDGIHPGKVRPGLGSCSFSWGGAEHFSSTYYVCHPYWTPEIGNNLAYVLSSSEYLVTRPIVAGNDTDGSPLYICQALINGGLYPGKVGPSSSFAGGCSIAIDGKELYVMNFGLLTDGVYGNPDKPFP